MRFKIKFSLSSEKQDLPLNYQYPVSAWIYKVLSSANKEFTNRLHNEGYKLENGKAFKLFTFSRLEFPKNTWKIKKNSDRMQIWARNCWLIVSFQLPEQSENFVMGLFKEQKAFIGDKVSGIKMNVESIEALKNVEIGGFGDVGIGRLEDGGIGRLGDVGIGRLGDVGIGECGDVGIGRFGDVGIGRLEDVKIGGCVNVKVGAKTAIVLGIDVESEENEQYVLPIHADYGSVFLQNLVDKYIATGKSPIDVNCMNFQVTKLYTKTNMQTIKAYTSAQTKVKGYYYEFELTAPKDIIKVGLNAGFGSMNALGFGFCEVV